LTGVPIVKPSVEVSMRVMKKKRGSADEDERILTATRRLYPGYEDIFVLAEEVGYRKSELLRAVAGDYDPTTHKIAEGVRGSQRSADHLPVRAGCRGHPRCPQPEGAKRGRGELARGRGAAQSD
jgi:hypothetical protein